MRRIMSGMLMAALLLGQIPQAQAASRYKIKVFVDKEEQAVVEEVKPSRVESGEDSKIVFRLENDYELKEIKIQDREEDEDYYVSKDGDEIQLSDDTSCELEIDKRKITLWLYEIESDYDVTLYADKIDTEDEGSDDDEVRLSLSAEPGLTIRSDKGTRPNLGDTVNIKIQPDAGYQVGTITMTIGDKSASAEPSENVIRIDRQPYYISSELDGSRVLIIRNVGRSMKIRAEAIRGSHGQGSGNDGQPQYTIMANGDIGVSVLPSASNASKGGMVSFRISPQLGYELQSITLKVGTAVKTFAPSVTQVNVGGQVYMLGKDGRDVILFVNDISSSVSVTAASQQAYIPPVPQKPAAPQKPTPPSKPTVPQKPTPPSKPAVPQKPTPPSKPAATKPAKQTPPPQKPSIPVQAKENSFDPANKKAFLQGNGNGTITPEAAITRAEASAILDRLIAYTNPEKAKPSFQDVKSSDWFAAAVGRLERIGAYEVEKNGNFRPHDKITRGELIHWIAQIDRGTTTVPCSYTDVDPDNVYYMGIAYGTHQGWINGYADGTFRPDAPIARSEAAHMVLRMMGWQPDEAAIAGVGKVFSDMDPQYWAYNQVTAAARGLYRT